MARGRVIDVSQSCRWHCLAKFAARRESLQDGGAGGRACMTRPGHRYEEADAACRQALELQPDLTLALSGSRRRGQATVGAAGAVEAPDAWYTSCAWVTQSLYV